MALSEITRHMQMGNCCRICDRKFFLRASFQQYHNKITHYVAEAQEYEQSLNIVKIDLDELQEEQREIDEKAKREEDRYIKEDVKQRLKLERLQIEQDRMEQ